MTARYSRRLEHLVPDRTPDGAGGGETAWVPRGAIWAKVRMRSGGMKPTEFGRRPRLRLRILTHAVPQGHPSRPAPGDRLREGSRLYEVEAAHEQDPWELTILAAEIPQEGGTP